MTPGTMRRLLLLQTLVIVALAWSVVLLGRDEYRLAAGRVADDDLSSASRVETDEAGGLPEVRLSAAAQRQVGLVLAAPGTATGAAPAETVLTVVDPQPLLEWRGRLQAARQAVEQAAAAARVSETERQRMQALYDDDRNASQRSLEQARAQAAADQRQWRGAQAQFAALADQARAAWGPGPAAWLPGPGPASVGGEAHLAALAAGREVLLRSVVGVDEPAAPPQRLRWTDPARPAAREARLLGPWPAPVGAEASTGRHLLYLAPGAGLAVGQRLRASAPASRGAPTLDAREGARGRAAREDDDERLAGDGAASVPSSAVIWHAGQPWIYLRLGADDDEARGPGAAAAASGAASGTPAASGAAPPDRFQRRALIGARRVGEQWIVPGLDDDAAVVVRGAQVLLSEELKSQLKHEADD